MGLEPGYGRYRAHTLTVKVGPRILHLAEPVQNAPSAHAVSGTCTLVHLFLRKQCTQTTATLGCSLVRRIHGGNAAVNHKIRGA